MRRLPRGRCPECGAPGESARYQFGAGEVVVSCPRGDHYLLSRAKPDLREDVTPEEARKFAEELFAFLETVVRGPRAQLALLELSQILDAKTPEFLAHLRERGLVA